MQRSLEQHFAEYCRDGYTLFRGYMPPEQLCAVRATVDPEFAQRFAEHPDSARTTIANILGHDALSPLLTQHIINSHVLDFAERVMGPFVQLDSFEITGFPSRPTNERNQVAQWHRDAFNYSDMWGTHPASQHFKSHCGARAKRPAHLAALWHRPALCCARASGVATDDSGRPGGAGRMIHTN